MFNINEATNWNLRASLDARYRSIGSYIRHVDESESLFADLKNKILQSGGGSLVIVNIYEVVRPNETINYAQNIGNHRLLYHGTRVRNALGILSRGLMLPKYVVDEIGLSRSDIGMLGAGIYFSDSIQTSLKYAYPSTIRNTRLVGVFEVALGNCKDYFNFETGLTQPPKCYNSTHGVKKVDSNESSFNDDEYVIYSASQQKLRYIVEMTHDQERPRKAQDAELQQVVENQDPEVIERVEEDEIAKLDKGRDALEKTEFGLLSKAGQHMPLKSVHVRAQLLDMVSRVVIFQEYENEEDSLIEAKYVFPLDEGATVCGFEAFINEKHVIGVCKEKEQAHREYREAITKGQGAYLMDQESAELFTLNVGNLPPKCRCIIKITYIAELNIELEDIVFRLPCHVAPWISAKVKDEFQNEERFDKDQNESKVANSLISKYIDTMHCEHTSLELSIMMPYEIRKVVSTTHKVNIKQTACMAVVS
jgi:poly [ADP-ribose] polymerase